MECGNGGDEYHRPLRFYEFRESCHRGENGTVEVTGCKLIKRRRLKIGDGPAHGDAGIIYEAVYTSPRFCSVPDELSGPVLRRDIAGDRR